MGDKVRWTPSSMSATFPNEMEKTMGYVLKQVSPEDRARIMNDADEEKQRLLKRHGGHFNNDPDLEWAIDSDRGFYLMRAPTIEPRSTDGYFFFFFDGRMYALRVQGLYGPEVILDDPVDVDVYPALTREITAAFAVHKFRGRDFAPVFQTVGGR